MQTALLVLVINNHEIANHVHQGISGNEISLLEIIVSGTGSTPKVFFLIKDLPAIQRGVQSFFKKS